MDNSKGFIKLFRTILDWEWFCDVNTAHLFVYCLLKANFQDKLWQGRLIQRGSFITSYEKMAQETGLSVKNIRTSLEKLRGLVEHYATNKYSIIKVKNYDDYQGGNAVIPKPFEHKAQVRRNKKTSSSSLKNASAYEEYVPQKYEEITEVEDEYIRQIQAQLRAKLEQVRTENG